jgi:hypothetical protein
VVITKLILWGLLPPLEETYLAGVEEIIISDQYLLVTGVGLFFTVFALVKRTLALDAIATMFWWIVGGVHLVASPATSPLFSISFLWFGLGLIFLVLSFHDVWKFYSVKREQDQIFEEEL